MQYTEDLVRRARSFAYEAHGSIVCPNTGLNGHRRKFEPFPCYNVHTDEVEAIYAEYFPTDYVGRAVCHLHDYLEDVTPNSAVYTYERLLDEMGVEVTEGVVDLTDLYVKGAYPQFNRKFRKAKEAHRLSLTPPASQSRKLCDLISNTSDIVRNDPGFAVTYLKEKKALLPKLILGDVRIWTRAATLAEQGFRQLGLQW